MIYLQGRNCDAITAFAPQVPNPLPSNYMTPAYQQWQRFAIARQRYVQLRAARSLILNLWDVNASRGGKTLGNFSVTRHSQTKDDDVPKKLTELDQEIKDWEIVVRSGGTITVGGRAASSIAQKGVCGDRDRSPGRLR
jgi:hypothetical protein